MLNPILLPCDGCGQLADSAHISRRLERLAWATRFRPLHIQALILGAIVPKLNSDFLYSPNETFHGEASTILKAIQLTTEGKSPEAVLTEFQKLGLMLTHVLECPLDENVTASEAHSLLEKQLPATIARIRRSLKPKRLLLISRELQPHADRFYQANLPCPVFPAATTALLPSLTPTETDLQSFRTALAISNAPAL
jgi:hypothetical protein